MSIKHPIISVTGSSGAGTTTVKHTFSQIFRRENVNEASIEGDAFHRYNRVEMKQRTNEESKKVDSHFSHFGPEANLFERLGETFKAYGETGTTTTRHYMEQHFLSQYGNNISVSSELIVLLHNVCACTN